MAALPAALLLLADPRTPAGGHGHSGGVEPAVFAGLVHDHASLRSFLAGRLATTGLVAAAVAAFACRADPPWALLDAEVDARTPSVAQRAASRAQGRGLLRAASAAWPSEVLAGLAGGTSGGTGGVSGRGAVVAAPHHAVVLGACAFVVGGTPHAAAALAASASVTGPAWAAVRLLGLDPFGVHAVLASLATRIDAVALAAAAAGHPADLPARSAPVLDLLAELHPHQEVRLFES